jgi:YD repeat-containing protein
MGALTMGRIRVMRQFAVTVLCASLIALSCTPANAANGSVTYTYDALGRVTSVSYDTGVVIIYTYDANGNRTQQVINVNTSTMKWDNSPTPWSAAVWG